MSYAGVGDGGIMAATTFDTIYLTKKDYEVIMEEPMQLNGRLMAVLLVLVNFLWLISKLPLPSTITIMFTLPWFVDCYTIQLKYHVPTLIIDLFTYLIFGI